MAALTREQAEAYKAEAVEDPLCACKVVKKGPGPWPIVPTAAAIKAADEAAKATHERRTANG